MTTKGGKLLAVVAVVSLGALLPAAPVPKPPPANLYLTCSDGIHVVTPDGKAKDTLPPVRAENFRVKEATVSPDGVWVAYLATMVRPGREGPDRAVFVRKLTDKDGEKRLAWRKFGHLLGWVGGTLYYRGGDDYSNNQPEPLGVFVTGSMKVFAYDTTTEKTAEHDLPEDHLPEHVTPDGKAVVSQKWTTDGKTATGKLCRVTLADGKVKELIDLEKETFGGYGKPGAMSPDGGHLLGIWTEWDKMTVRGRGKLPPFGEAHVTHDDSQFESAVSIDTATGKRTGLKLKWERASINTRWAWSPDGGKVAMVRSKKRERRNDDPPNKPETWEYVITTCDADGGGSKPLATVEGGHLFGFDWR